MQFESTTAEHSESYCSSLTSLIASDAEPIEYSTFLSENEFEEPQLYSSERSTSKASATFGYHGFYRRSTISRFSHSSWEEAKELAAESVSQHTRRISQDGLRTYLPIVRNVFPIYYLRLCLSSVEQILFRAILSFKMSPTAANSFFSASSSLFVPKDLRFISSNTHSSYTSSILLCLALYLIYLQSDSTESSPSPSSDHLDHSNPHNIDNLLYYYSTYSSNGKTSSQLLSRRLQLATGTLNIHSSLLASSSSSLASLPVVSPACPVPIPIAQSTRYLLHPFASVLEDYLLVLQSTLLSNNFLIKSLTGKRSTCYLGSCESVCVRVQSPMFSDTDLRVCFVEVQGVF